MRRIHSYLTGARVACGNVIVIDVALTLFLTLEGKTAALILLMTWPLGGETQEAREMANVMKDLYLYAMLANVALCALDLCCIGAARFLCWAEGTAADQTGAKELLRIPAPRARSDLWNRPLSVWTPFTEDYQEKIAIDINAKLHRIGAKIAHAKACRDVFGSLWWSGAVIADILWLAVLSFDVEIALSKFCNELVAMWAMAHVLGWFQRHAAELPGTLNPRSLSSMQLPAQTGHLDQCNVDSLLSTEHNFLDVWPCIAPSPRSTAIGLYAVFAI